jgi:hypothetical protein
MKRKFVGGCTGYVHPVAQDSRPARGCVGWAVGW